MKAPTSPAALAALLATALMTPAASRAQSDRGLDVRVLPEAQTVVSPEQLEAALIPRIAHLGRPLVEAPLRITVARGREDRLQVLAGDRSGEVAVGARRGPEAARLAALVLVDLISEDPAAPPATIQVPAEPRPAGRLEVVMGVAGASGLTTAGHALEPLLGMGVGLARALTLRIEAGYGAVAAGPEPGARLALRWVPLRAGLAFRSGLLEVALSGSARPYWLRGPGAPPATGVVWGGGLSLALFLPVAWSVRPLARIGLDAHAQRLDVRVAGRPALGTGRLVPWAALAIAWRSR